MGQRANDSYMVKINKLWSVCPPCSISLITGALRIQSNKGSAFSVKV